MILGVIADDFTGATDIAGFLVENGMSCVQLSGIPQQDIKVDADAVVISLKSRSCLPSEAIEASVAALKWLKEKGCEQYYFKYCSTFDSTSKGNIGPVTDALMDELGEELTIVCPSLPINGRTVFNGYLYVNGLLLSESGMRNHPINPMLDSNLLRLMEMQSNGKAGLVDYKSIGKGDVAIIESLDRLKRDGVRYAVLDAFDDHHLDHIGKAARHIKLVTGGSGLAVGLAKSWVEYLSQDKGASSFYLIKGNKTVVLSGSCSEMTNQQVSFYKQKAPSYLLDVRACIEQSDYADQVADWVISKFDQPLAPMVYATTDPVTLKDIQKDFGGEQASQAIEQLFSRLAHQLKERDVTNFIVAGGETSGVVTQSLEVFGFYIGPQISPGVPWVKAINSDIALALKSGNFGDEEFFLRAQGHLV